MKLYYIPTTRAFRPRWLLEEINQPYELVYVTMDMTRQPEYKKIHPHGKVPVLIDGDVCIIESAAICCYLTDKFADQNFAPAVNNPARAYYYQWLFYATLTLEAPVEQYMFHVLPNLPEKVLPKSDQTRVSQEDSLIWFEKVCEPLNEILKHQDYLVENRFTTADIITGGVFLWALKLGMMVNSSPVKDYILKLMDRPAFQKADDHAPYQAL
jgi:glutathione S-transferase